MRSFARTTFLLATIVAGCSRSAPQFESLPTYPVEGRVLVQGKPVEGVQVFLHPRDPSQRGKPRGTTNAEGRRRESSLCYRKRRSRGGRMSGAASRARTAAFPALPATRALRCQPATNCGKSGKCSRRQAKSHRSNCPGSSRHRRERIPDGTKSWGST